MNVSFGQPFRRLAFGLLLASTVAVPAQAGFGLFDHGCDTNCDTPGCGTSLCETSLCESAACDMGCDGGCDAGCGCGAQLGCLSNLDALGCGLIKPSDHCFDDFISPMINFVHFEDPRTLTEIRPIFVNHWVPDNIGSGVPAGGSIQLLALQFRVALTERLSLIGVKDGYIFDSTDNALDTLLDDGWAAVTAGLKYNLLRDTRSGTLASVGATYEIPGSDDALQDVGDGEFHLFMTGGKRLYNGNAHWLSAFGVRLPVDDEVQTESIHWSNHFDVRLTDSVYLLTEVAWWHWTDDATSGLPLGVAGQDLFNLPATNVAGNDLVTQNVGLKWKPTAHAEYGLAYEFPLTEFKDVIDGRLQAEAIFRY